MVPQAILGMFCFCHKRVRICLLFLDATVVNATVLIADDEWDDSVTEALFHHDQPAEAAVSIFKGMDAFEPNMEIQDLISSKPNEEIIRMAIPEFLRFNIAESEVRNVC